MTQPIQPAWLCMHNGTARGPDLRTGTRVLGVVVCVHVFGVGVYIAAQGVFGHVNVPELIDEGPLVSLADYPAVGSALNLVVLGRSGHADQLRLGRASS